MLFRMGRKWMGSNSPLLFRLLNYSRRGILLMPLHSPGGTYNLLVWKVRVAPGTKFQVYLVITTKTTCLICKPVLQRWTNVIIFWPRFGSQICSAQLLMPGNGLLITDLELFLELTVESSTASKGDVESFPHTGTFPMTKMFSREVRSQLGWLQDRGGYLTWFPGSQVVIV